MSGRRLRRGNWSVQELERLRHLLPRRGVDDTARLLRRSPESVRRKAHTLLAAPVARRTPWTATEDLQLRSAWGALELRLLAVMLGRPAVEVSRRAMALASQPLQGPWSRGEDRLCLQNHPRRPVKADSFHHSLVSLRRVDRSSFGPSR